jgi:hypothetical protein
MTHSRHNVTRALSISFSCSGSCEDSNKPGHDLGRAPPKFADWIRHPSPTKSLNSNTTTEKLFYYFSGAAGAPQGQLGPMIPFGHPYGPAKPPLAPAVTVQASITDETRSAMPQDTSYLPSGVVYLLERLIGASTPNTRETKELQNTS